MDITGKKCPDCGHPLKAIMVLGNPIAGRPPQGELASYTVPEAKRSFWTGRYPIQGKVATYMCDDCGRILLYGEPHEAEGT